MVIKKLFEKANNSGLDKRINNTKLGQFVEKSSRRYMPRLSDLISLPFAAVARGGDAVGDFLDGGMVAAYESSGNNDYSYVLELPLDLVMAGVYWASVGLSLVGAIGTAITREPLAYIENKVLGEREIGNVFEEFTDLS